MSTTKWSIDPAHSQIIFKARHMMITTVTGVFKEFGAEAEFAANDLSEGKVSFWANVKSIDTGSAQRDAHLHSADFFNADLNPQILFQSTAISKKGDGKYLLSGDFSMNGVSKNVSFDLDHMGTAKDPWGNTKAGFIIKGKVNRKDWNLNWNVALEAGGILVSEEVEILCEVQMAQQA